MSAETHWFESYLLNNSGKLVIFAVFSYLLGEIVPERVFHNVHECINGLLEYQILDVFITVFYFLLEQAATTLVLSQDTRILQKGKKIIVA